MSTGSDSVTILRTYYRNRLLLQPGFVLNNILHNYEGREPFTVILSVWHFRYWHACFWQLLCWWFKLIYTKQDTPDWDNVVNEVRIFVLYVRFWWFDLGVVVLHNCSLGSRTNISLLVLTSVCVWFVLSHWHCCLNAMT